ncbi:MAG: aminotransferase class IV [bacterium]|nr:aminotransferase class IV [bacterium]
MKKYCYLNGKVMPLEKAKIDPYDLGVLRGYCVFDVMCTENGKPFLLDDHWKRLQNSAKELNLTIPVKKEDYEKILKDLLTRNGFKKSTIRTVLTGGISSDAFSPEKKETFFILIEKFHEYEKELYEKGIKLITVEHSRFLPRAKIASYIMALKNYDNRVKNGAFEILYVEDGNVLEASTSNIFLVKNGKLITPKEKILFGITRNLVIKLAKSAKIKVEEREIKTSELTNADEIFIAATNKEIMPVVKVDNQKIKNEKVGEMTKELMEKFEEFAVKY